MGTKCSEAFPNPPGLLRLSQTCGHDSDRRYPAVSLGRAHADRDGLPPCRAQNLVLRRQLSNRKFHSGFAAKPKDAHIVVKCESADPHEVAELK